MRHSTCCDDSVTADAAEVDGAAAAGCGNPGGGRNVGTHKPGGGSTSSGRASNPSPGGGATASSRAGKESTLTATGEAGNPGSGPNDTFFGDEAALVLGVALHEPTSVRSSSILLAS